MLTKITIKPIMTLTAVMVATLGFYSVADAKQSVSPEAPVAAENAEIAMLKQRLDAQERAIGNLIRYNDPFAVFQQNMGDLFIPAVDMRVNFADVPMAGRPNVFSRMNVSDLKDKIEISVEMPGMDKGDINIEVKDNLLTISGEKKDAKEIKEGDYYMQERQFGTFNRSIKLPPNVDVNKISSNLKNGVLTIIIPKTEEKPMEVKKIPVD